MYTNPIIDSRSPQSIVVGVRAEGPLAPRPWVFKASCGAPGTAKPFYGKPRVELLYRGGQPLLYEKVDVTDSFKNKFRLPPTFTSQDGICLKSIMNLTQTVPVA